ncbi:uncharacterized protein TNCV_1414441 [Trichonephila clavipes]|nr:uncharacterized protein TNCV_1414441 [Trichonephila clavipes]
MAHQADFDEFISQNCTLLMLTETWLYNDERVSIPNFDCCVQFKRPGYMAASVAICHKQNNSRVVTPHMAIIYRQTSGLGTASEDSGHICAAACVFGNGQTMIWVAANFSPNQTVQKIKDFLHFVL